MPSRLEQERFTKMNRKSVNTCLTDMINISIEIFKLLLNEIKMHFSLKAGLMRTGAETENVECRC